MKIQLKYFSVLMILFFFQSSVWADDEKKFLYTKSSEVNVRAGPEKRYPIKFVIKNKGEPVLVVSEFEHWLKIRDIDGDEGWVHESMVNHAVHGVLLSKRIEVLYAAPSETSKPIARLENGIRFKVKKCVSINWCLISIDGLSGWIQEKHIWGIN